VRFPVASNHGISDPRANQRTRLRLQGQKVSIRGSAANHSEIFPEFVRILGGDASARTIRVVHLLAQVPSIHRAFCRVTESNPLFTPVKRVELLRSQTHVWARLALDKHDKDVK